MVEALKWFSTVISDQQAPIMARRLALYYVAHLVGDMHQPLHAGRAGDQGGVDIPVSYRNATTNLHYFWDSDLVEMEPLKGSLMPGGFETVLPRQGMADLILWLRSP